METYNLITNIKSMYVSENPLDSQKSINATIGTVADLMTKVLLSTLDIGDNTPADDIGTRSSYNEQKLDLSQNM